MLLHFFSWQVASYLILLACYKDLYDDSRNYVERTRQGERVVGGEKEGFLALLLQKLFTAQPV